MIYQFYQDIEYIAISGVKVIWLLYKDSSGIPGRSLFADTTVQVVSCPSEARIVQDRWGPMR